MKAYFQRSIAASAAMALAIFVSASANAQEPPPSPEPPVVADPAVPPQPTEPPQPDPKLIKEIEQMLKQRYSRDPSDLLRHLDRVGTADPATLTVTNRFNHHFITGDWNRLREELAQMPLELPRKLYDKVLADLSQNQKPNMQLEDVLGLADAVPGEFTSDNLRKLGQLIKIAVPVGESYWLVDRLRKGSDKVGGTDPGTRLTAARILMAANFKDLAREYLPPMADIEKLSDEGLKRELLRFVATQEERINAQRADVQRVWDKNISEVLAPVLERGKAWEKTRASDAIAKVLTQMPVSTLESVLTEAAKTNPEGAMRLVSAFTQKVQNERNHTVENRTENLAAQATIANLLIGVVKPGEQPWNRIFEMMADQWIDQADTTHTEISKQHPGKYVEPEELLAVAPAGKWAAALPSSMRDRIDVSMSRLILTGSRFDQAADRIVEIGKRSPAAGAALAEEFLVVWAKSHNPEIPEKLRRQYGLPEDARIPVTPIMMEKNINSLARMMTLFRDTGLAPEDYSQVVTAFDLAYSTAETYRTPHIEKVFGPMNQMDEPVFSLILKQMNANLGERWRKMEVQQAGLTRRDESETLEMVRKGYDTALKLIDSWLEGHPDAWRPLTLAGTLLVDWGDFEYFQELVADDPKMRIFGFKEKNLRAQDYFNRGAAAYGKQVAKLPAGEYTVEPYLAWFNGLLGIGSNDQLNLSKAMNRTALTKIRKYLEALPDGAGAAHIGLFAKVVKTRLDDTANPLHEDLRYRYLAGATIITKDDPFTFGAAKDLAYFDELLSEVRLETRVDGPNTVGRDQDFGIILSIIHTEAMGRAAKFGQYLTNDPAAGVNKRPSPKVKTMSQAQGPRDELELNIREAMTPFFDIKTITFATTDVKSRPTAKPGWEETVLAYLHVRAKDASVDKIPPIGLALKFVDMTGPVSIPAESAETLIKIATDTAPARPANQITITQTLDTRQLTINGTLSLEIAATATGLVPDLEQLLDLPKDEAAIAIQHVNPHENLQIKELNTWGDEITPTSERLWTITLDGDAVRAATGPLEFQFPTPKATDASITYQTYREMDLITLSESVVTLGPSAEGNAAELLANPAKHPVLWLVGICCGVIGIGLIFVLFRRRGRERPLRARDVFHMPDDVDEFAVVALLRRLRSSPLVHLKEEQQLELQSDIQSLQQTGFGAESTLPDNDLRKIASKWLRCVS
ncbi:MAG: hypothetical protein ACJAQT_000034 [Akkermansiaceae bacterium]|jgi:hypothetical protein